jgi:hypothetical protein
MLYIYMYVCFAVALPALLKVGVSQIGIIYNHRRPGNCVELPDRPDDGWGCYILVSKK